MPRLRLALLLTLLAGIAPTHGSASTLAVPAPPNCTLPSCLAPCPMGDQSFVVTVRDIAGVPVAQSFVVMDFSSCPGAYLCSGLPLDPYVLDVPTRTLRALTNASGTIDFKPRVGGTGGPGSVRVYADGILLAQYALASPDQSANGFVLSTLDTDLPILTGKLGTTDPTADFDCSGIVDSADRFYFGFHESHSCGGWVDPARQRTWGGLKVHHR